MENTLGKIEFLINKTVVGQNVQSLEIEDVEKVASTTIHKSLNLGTDHTVPALLMELKWVMNNIMNDIVTSFNEL